MIPSVLASFDSITSRFCQDYFGTASRVLAVPVVNLLVVP